MVARRVLAHVDIDERHHQPYGIVHGGVWASIVESVASHGAAQAAMELGGVAGVVGTSNLTDFLRSHSDGRVDAIATPVFVGRTQQLWAVEVSRAVRRQARRPRPGALPEPQGAPGRPPPLTCKAAA